MPRFICLEKIKRNYCENLCGYRISFRSKYDRIKSVRSSPSNRERGPRNRHGHEYWSIERPRIHSCRKRYCRDSELGERKSSCKSNFRVLPVKKSFKIPSLFVVLGVYSGILLNRIPDVCLVKIFAEQRIGIITSKASVVNPSGGQYE